MGWEKRLFALTASTAVLLSGCGLSGKEPAAKPVVAEQAPPDSKVVETVKEPVFRFPLTGLAAEKEVKDRPVAVMVENSPAARPQSGLHQADVVYEVLAEGEITRFVAIYQSSPAERIGPVRSIRPYLVKLGDGHDALLVHAGWSPDAMELMQRNKLNHFDQVYGDDKYYWRDSSRKAPHNLYTSIAKIREGAEDKKFRAEWKGGALAFMSNAEAVAAGLYVAPAEAGGGAGKAAGQAGSKGEAAPGASVAASASPSGTAGGGAGASGAASGSGKAAADGAAVPAGASAGKEAAASVRAEYIRGYDVEYKYNESTKRYERYMEGEPHQDKDTGETLTAANVLIVEAEHQILDDVGRRDVNIDGPGQGYYAAGGMIRPIEWKRTGGIITAYENGKPVKLLSGQTWVQIVPVGSKVEWSK
ncbi:DUF3048 domain-containing protein [Paenibacillus turpanensis]|uniref:DUF3048 domain-containing protein n=1 Tax=Paenibacillus turpanensis TaxID=2689078 RepID=UPI00140C7960|nr:DUF3048 domain-containing protein [Paenibacillus turpanensis]